VTVEAAYAALLDRASADPHVVGVVVFGSRAVGADIRPTSDVDCFVIVDGPVEEARAWQTPHGSPVEVWAVTLEMFRAHGLPGAPTAWNRPSLIRARVDLDKLDGGIAALVDAKRRLGPDEARAVAEEALGDALNSIYRALKTAENGHELASRLDAGASISPLLTAVFALEGRVRPWNQWLEHELALEPLRTAAFERLLELVRALATDPAPHQLRTAFRMLEAAARTAGHGPLVDGWEPDVAWLRGDAPARDRITPRRR
jgi:hypothetical protein